MDGTITKEDLLRQPMPKMNPLTLPKEYIEAITHMTNPPSSPQPTDTAEKLYLQIRICGEQYTGSKYVKKEYRIELPANVGELGEPYIKDPGEHRGTQYVCIPVILHLPASDSIEVVTQPQHISKEL